MTGQVQKTNLLNQIRTQALIVGPGLRGSSRFGRPATPIGATVAIGGRGLLLQLSTPP